MVISVCFRLLTEKKATVSILTNGSLQGFKALAFLGAYYALITHFGLIIQYIRKDVLSSACRFIGASHTLQCRFTYIACQQPKRKD